MEDIAITLSSLVAYTLWALSAVLMVVAILFWDDQAAHHLGRIALLACGAAVTAHVRAYHIATRRHLSAVLASDGPLRKIH